MRSCTGTTGNARKAQINPVWPSHAPLRHALRRPDLPNSGRGAPAYLFAGLHVDNSGGDRQLVVPFGSRGRAKRRLGAALRAHASAALRVQISRFGGEYSRGSCRGHRRWRGSAYCFFAAFGCGWLYRGAGLAAGPGLGGRDLVSWSTRALTPSSRHCRPTSKLWSAVRTVPCRTVRPSLLISG
jgi:hypothetical protein